MGSSILTEKHYSLIASKDVRDICVPLKKYGISYFSYTRFFNDGSAYALTTHWDSFSYHYNKQYDICPPIPTGLMSDKFYYMPTLFEPTPSFIQAIQAYRDKFKTSYPIYMFEKYPAYTDLFIYGSTPDNPGIINFYLNNLDVLEKFKFYFKDRARKLIEKSTKNRIIMPGYIHSIFNDSENINALDDNKIQLLKELTAKNYILSGVHADISITRRELDILACFAKGYLVKETANALKLAPKTVESYLNNVKNKLGLQRKSQIIDFLSRYNLF